MEKVIKEYLNNDLELIKKYKKAEDKYYKKLGMKYETIKLELDFNDEIKKLFRVLANIGICFDEYISSKLKTIIVEREMDKL